ncbi:hypothetical protein ACP70R_047211 [Stipagrostis hirtigluma subsp. patula]
MLIIRHAEVTYMGAKPFFPLRTQPNQTPKRTMPLARFFTASGVLLPLLLLLSASPPCHGATSTSISDILAAYPEFSEFSGALTSTGLAAEIDRRNTITVLAVDNAVMDQLQARHLQQDDLRRAISLQVLLDYFDDSKLHSLQGNFTQATSLYQASGQAPGSAGIVNITVLGGGRVAFVQSGSSDAPPAVFYQKSVKETPYNISVLQVSALISYPAAGAQAPAPALAPTADAAAGFTHLLSKNGCGSFAGLVAATPDAAATYGRDAGSGLTVFCPADNAVAAFMPTFKNLTVDGQIALLLYHGSPAHYSKQSLKTMINADVPTLAMDGSKSYNLTIRADGDTVKLSSSAPQSEAKVIKTAVDKAPLAVYLIDAVLLPAGDLSNSSRSRPAPSPAPAPATARGGAPAPVLAPTPASAPTPSRRPALPPKEAPEPSPDADSEPAADKTAKKSNGASGMTPWSLGAAVAAAMPAILLVLW